MKFYKFLCQFIKIRHRRTALDKPLYKLAAGRSMVEMLGVLAIIGVLSIGAISGYSKAMMKYKLNKALEQSTYVLHLAYLYLQDFQSSHPSSTLYLTSYYVKMGLIPEEMIKKNISNYVYDKLNNQIAIAEIGSNNQTRTFGISTHTILDKNIQISYCQNMIEFAKQYSDDITALRIWSAKTANFYFYGNLHANNPAFKNSLLKSSSFQQIMLACQQVVNEDAFYMHIEFKIP